MGFIDANSLTSLGLNQTQIDALDALDGNKDGKIEQSIFDAAKAIVTNDSVAMKTAQKVTNAAGLFEKIKNAISGKVAPHATKGTENTANATKASESNNAKKAESPQPVNNKKEVPEEVSKMQELADAAVKYFEENNGKLEGFKFTGFPRGIEALNITTQQGFDDTSNDVFTIKSNGEQGVTRYVDAITLTLKFDFGGKTYTVESEAKITKGSMYQGTTQFERIRDLMTDVNSNSKAE